MIGAVLLVLLGAGFVLFTAGLGFAMVFGAFAAVYLAVLNTFGLVCGGILYAVLKRRGVFERYATTDDWTRPASIALKWVLRVALAFMALLELLVVVAVCGMAMSTSAV